MLTAVATMTKDNLVGNQSSDYKEVNAAYRPTCLNQCRDGCTLTALCLVATLPGVVREMCFKSSSCCMRVIFLPWTDSTHQVHNIFVYTLSRDLAGCFEKHMTASRWLCVSTINCQYQCLLSPTEIVHSTLSDANARAHNLISAVQTPLCKLCKRRLHNAWHACLVSIPLLRT